MKNIRVYTDGGARGNPGPAGIGVVIKEVDGNREETIQEISKYIGETTNNQAEYQAVIEGLKALQDVKAASVEFVLDSELVVKQLNREYKVKDPDLAKKFLEVWNLLGPLPKVAFRHVKREHNKEADALVNEALDEETGN